MGLNPPVPQQDSNWEIRAAVLLSLFFQVLLIFLGPRRKRTSTPLFRLTVWSCYLLANYSRLMTAFDSKKMAGLPVELAIYDAQELEITKDELTKEELNADILRVKKSLKARAYRLFLIFRRLLVDVIISSKERLMSQAFFDRIRSFSDADDERTFIRKAFEVMAVELNFMYDMVYTKAPVAHSGAGLVLRCICSGCLVSALAVFFFLDKPGHQIQRVDVGITYVLMLGALALDAVAMLMLFCSDLAQVYLEELSSQQLRWLLWLSWLRQQVTKRWQTPRRWSGTVSQMNLIRYCQEKPGPYSRSDNRGGKWWLMIVKMLGVEEIVDDFVFIRRVRLKKDEEEERCGCLGRFFRERLVPKCCRNDSSVSESLLFGFIFRSLKDALHKLKKEQEERKKAAAAQKLKMEQKTKAAAAAAAAGTGTGTPEEATEEEIEAEKDAVAEKDAIAEVCRRRGDGVVKSHKDRISKETTTTEYKVILDSVVKSDFDESLLLWHIATDLCLLRNYQGPMLEKPTGMQAIAETLSEYMLYLLIKQPDMLAATAGIGLRPYRDTCAEARRFFASKEAWLGIDKEHGMRKFLLSVNTSETRPASMKGDRSKSVPFDAVILAKALRKLDEELVWDVIARVWVEMLSFAAVSGRGRTHVRNLNRGGELITFVWLLMQHLGLSDMYEIQQGDPGVQLIVHY